ncbi:MAG TPA: tetratricopeptide repeat protein [Chthonomonadaceae bacterium]|nr:tetratricopeptide repeat protein [Chthonomonadaceae bacterium]
MKGYRRLVVLIVILIIGAGVSAWVNVPPWLTRRRAADHYRQGQEFARKGVMDSALAEWRIATRLDPDYPEPYHRVGEFLLNQAQRPDLAGEVFARLAVIDPDGPHVYCNYAKALALQNEMAEARQYAQLAVKTEPNCGLAHNMLGVVLTTDQQVSAGLKELERACALSPQNNDFALILAQAYLDTSNFTGAQRTLEGVLQRSPDNARAHYMLGWAIIRKSRAPDAVEKALGHFREAAHLEPDDAEAYSEWGKLLLQTGRTAEAVQVLSKAWELNPRIVQVAHNLAAAYRQAGQEPKAQAMEKQEQILLERITRLRVLEKKAKADPHDLDIVLKLAEAEMQDGNLTDAMRYVQGVLRVRPADRAALELLAQIYAVGGKPDMAEAVRVHLRTLPGSPIK